MSEQAEPEKETSDTTDTPGDTILDVSSITKTFGGLVAVDEATFSIERGKTVGLIGPNGAGKTTLFNVMTGFLEPDSGTVELDGNDVTHLAPHEHTKMGMARTFQEVKPFGNMSVIDNIIVGGFIDTNSTDEAREIALEVIETVGLAHLADEPANELTLEERKRMELGRALATQPNLLLLDEIMAGLAEDEMNALISLIQDINEEEGITIIVIEHVMDAVMELSDRIVVLDDGAVIAEGSPEEISTNDRVIRAYLGERWEEQS